VLGINDTNTVTAIVNPIRFIMALCMISSNETI